jgi:hypothetical protein
MLSVLNFLGDGLTMNLSYILKMESIVFPAERLVVLLHIITLRTDLLTELKVQVRYQLFFTI